MPFLRRPSFIARSMLLSVAALALVSCSGDEENVRRGAGLGAPQSLTGGVQQPAIPALNIAPSHGLKNDVYLSAELSQAMAQLQGVEQSLGQLESDLQGTAAALQRVDAMRQEIDALNIRFEALQERLAFAGPSAGLGIGPVTTTVETVTTELPVAAATVPAGPTPLMGEMAAPVSMTPMKPVVEASPAPKAAETVQTPTPASPPPTNSGPEGVRAVRVGEHADRVRIVFDIQGHANGYTTNLDSAEKLLTVELPKTKWSAGAGQQALGRNPVLASYTGQDNGSGGSLVAFSLKGPTRVLSSSVLKAEGGKPARLVIDLAR